MKHDDPLQMLFEIAVAYSWRNRQFGQDETNQAGEPAVGYERWR